MAWDIAAYGITVAVLAIAAACVFGIVKICRSLRRLEFDVKRLSKETEASLIQCRQLAEETKAAIIVSRQSLQGFSMLAEGARALGEAAQTVAQTATNAAASCRDHLASFITPVTDDRDQRTNKQPDWTELGRSLWLYWREKTGNLSSADSSHHSGPSADPSRGE